MSAHLPVLEGLFVSYGRTKPLKSQQPAPRKPLRPPRSGEVKDEDGKQLPTSCSKALHYATLPLSCVFPSMCERGVCVCVCGSTGLYDFFSERLAERLQRTHSHTKRRTLRFISESLRVKPTACFIVKPNITTQSEYGE